MKKTRLLTLLLIIAIAVSACKTKSSGKKPETSGNLKTTFVKAGSVERISPRMDNIIQPGELPEIIAKKFIWTEGPLWVPEQEMLLFSDIPANTVYRWSEKDGLKLYLKPSGYTDTIPRGGEKGSNALLLDNEGRLVLCQHGDRRMARMDAPLDKPEPRYITLADRWQGKRFNSPNDGIYNSHGDLFFTDPAYGMELRFADPKREIKFTGVYKLSSDGVLTLLTDKMTAPNGIGLSPDESKLYVANSGDGAQAYWMEYRFRKDGSLDEGKIFNEASKEMKVEKGPPDGLKVRKDGIIFAAGPGGIWIFSPDGEHLGTVRTGETTSNCSLDNKGKYLYMTADTTIMRIKLK